MPCRLSDPRSFTYSARVTTRILIGLGSIALLFATIPSADAATSAEAVPAWSMVPMSKDANRDGFIDGDGGVPASGALSLAPSTQFVGAGNGIAQPNERLIGGALSWYLDAAGYPVRLDACDSTGRTYTWTITGPDGRVTTTPPRALTGKACRQTVLLPEGRHSLRLTVRAGGGRDTAAVDADVRNILLVALGDSYASGVGNPRNVGAWLRGGGPFTAFRPYWDDAPCGRSTHGAPAQAALELERSSPTTSVTLVDVSCGGATVDAGVLGPQPGVDASQIEQVRRIIGPRTIDLVTLSVGGNDIGFSSVLLACATDAECPLSKATSGPLRGYPTVQDGIQAQLARLSSGFDRIAGCLGGSACTIGGPGADAPLPLTPGARVLPTMYPDITRAANGQPCTYLTFEPQNMAWARDTVLVPTPAPSYTYPSGRRGPVTFALPNGSLNSQIAATTRLGWSPVAGTWSASGDSAVGHGVCAGPQSWAYGLTALSGFASASFHPNPLGQAAAAQQIAAAGR